MSKSEEDGAYFLFLLAFYSAMLFLAVMIVIMFWELLLYVCIIIVFAYFTFNLNGDSKKAGFVITCIIRVSVAFRIPSLIKGYSQEYDEYKSKKAVSELELKPEKNQENKTLKKIIVKK